MRRAIFHAILAAILLVFALPFTPAVSASGSEEIRLDKAPVNLNDKASLQRGARNFVNYCLNCHNAQFMRYSHLTQLGLSEEQIKTNLMFTTDKIGDTMISALDPQDAKEWFGVVPPDLTLIARSRGPDWVYTFLRGFYRDDAMAIGWNNSVFPNVGMPHVLHELQGVQTMQKAGEHKGYDGHGGKTVLKLAIEKSGQLSEREYDQFVADLVNYLAYMSEPMRIQRTQIGVVVIFFLVVMFFMVLWLKHEYWKDVR